MFVVIRDGDTGLSLKARFIVQLLESSFNTHFLYVFRKDQEMFSEKVGPNKIELATSARGIILYFFLMLLKSPQDLREGLIRRLLNVNNQNKIVTKGFLSVLSAALYQYLGRSGRTDRLITFLRKLNLPMIFIIDEFWSLNSVRLKDLKDMGMIIYVSQDIAYNRYNYADNLFARTLLFRLERNFLANVNLVIACSETERIKYLEMGAKKVFVLPNFYPFGGFKSDKKDEMPSISIVMREHWGSTGQRFLEELFRSFGCLDRQIKVYVIGIKPKKVPKNVVLEYTKFITSKLDYLRKISKSWVGINIGIHMGGVNARKFDYAEAGAVVFSDFFGARGDLLPHEYTYVDFHDFAAKIKQLLEFDKADVIKMGKENREYVLQMAETKKREILNEISNLMLLHQ